MIGLADIRDWLEAAYTAAQWSIGRYDANKTQRACVYQRPDYSDATVAIGGETKTLVKHISVILHWNKNHRETEEAAAALFALMENNPRPAIGAGQVSYLDLLMPEAADMGADDNGIFERCIWLDIYFEEE